MLALDLARHLGAEIALDGGDATLISNVADIGRLDAKHAVAGVLEVRQQRAIVGADIDHHIVFAQAQHGGGFTLQISEIVSQQFSGPTGIRIFRRENDDGINCQAELYQVTVAAVQEVGRKPRLLAWHLPDRHHLVDGRHVAEREHIIERRVAADLTALDRNAGAGAGGTRDFGGAQGRILLGVSGRASQVLSASSALRQYQSSVALRPCSSGTRGL